MLPKELKEYIIILKFKNKLKARTTKSLIGQRKGTDSRLIGFYDP